AGTLAGDPATDACRGRGGVRRVARQLRRGHSATPGCPAHRRSAAPAAVDRCRSDEADAGHAVPGGPMRSARWAGWVALPLAVALWAVAAQLAKTSLLPAPAAVLETF